MSYHVFFGFSTSLARPLRVPAGTLERIRSHITATETTLGLKREPTFTPEGEKQRPGWHWRDATGDMLRELGPEPSLEGHQWWLAHREWETKKNRMAGAVREQNAFVQWLWDEFETAAKSRKRKDMERITVEESQEFWGGLQQLTWPREHWTKEHFTAHMEGLYELFQTRKHEGITLNCGRFTDRQIDALLWLMEGELDQWGFDLRFEVSRDDRLQRTGNLCTSYDGGYDWCEYCGPIDRDYFLRRVARCSRAKCGKCPLRNENPAEFDDEET